MEGRVAEAVTEAPEGLAGEIAVGAACRSGLECVVGEIGQAVERGVEGDGQTAGGVVEPGEGAGDGRTTLDAGIPCFEDCIGVLIGPVEGDGAAALQDDDERLTGDGQGFKEFLLRAPAGRGWCGRRR